MSIEQKERNYRQCSKNKLAYLECMRIIAIFFVIFNHTGSSGFFLFAKYPENSVPFWLYLFFSIFCRFSVPLFLAITGALMLGRSEEPLTILWKKRILKIIIILLFWSAVYYLFDNYHAGGVINWKDAIKRLYSSNLKYHLWYLYLYIAYLICLPFLKSLVANLKTKYFYYMFGIALFLEGILPVAEYFWKQGDISLNSHIRSMWLISDIVIYPCLGYFLQYKVDISKIKKKLPFIWIACCLGIGICCYMTYYKAQITGSWKEGENQTFHQSFVILICIAIFLSIKYLFVRLSIPNRINQIICVLGKATLGVYLIHLIIMNTNIMNNVLSYLRSMGLNYMIGIFIYCFIVMMIGFGVTIILSKIPVVKRLVGY